MKISGKAVKLEHGAHKATKRILLTWGKVTFFTKELMSSCGLIFLFLFLKQVDDEKKISEQYDYHENDF